jgi:hypothetical protein
MHGRSGVIQIILKKQKWNQKAQQLSEINIMKTYQFSILYATNPHENVGSNPARTNVTMWESLLVNLQKVGGLFPNDSIMYLGSLFHQ